MLALTPVPLQTAGERALFNELTRWDTGASVRAAVVASIPLVDGPLERRLSDAILFVPEGVAVVRIVEVVRQSGVVTAKPEGPWTIGPEGTPGAVLQLSGGGSSPLDGLMRAGMDTAQKLRRAGLEPGRIARLTVLAGDVTGLVPSDGDLGEGDQVALLEPRSLLLGVARASRYTGVDNPRLWTTADVRAALEALGLQGRGPSVEELNGEGFPYSPYVLRRPELLTPAAMAASPSAAGPAAPAPTAAPDAPPVREQPSSAAIAQAVAASAAAAHAAAASVAPPASVQSQRDTVAVDGPPALPDDNGIGGLFANAEPAQPSMTLVPPRTSVFPASPPPAAAPPASPPPAQPPGGRFSYWTAESQAGDAGAEGSDGGSGRRVLLTVLAGVVAVAVLGIGAWLFLRGGTDGDGSGAATGSTSAEPTAGGLEVGTVQEVGGVTYTVEAAETDDTCLGHAYGDTADFFADNDCTGLSRALYSAEIGGEPVVVSVNRVRLVDAAAARSLRSLTDRNGSGNVSDLLREGVRFTGSPAELSGAEYASAVSGPTVTIVESAWVNEDADGSSADIDQVATDALALAVGPFPAE
ncbi:MAG: uncharacterized protein JWP62_903 [Blastococcus sp.]|nr:uncharacterized protein [Blastococcus sp.]